jgi:hypothetical protein
MLSVIPPLEFLDLFSDQGFISVTNEMGINFFQHYLSQHLDNTSPTFLSHLVALNSNVIISTFADDPQTLKNLIHTYNHQMSLEVQDSNNTLNSIVSSVIERAQSELNIDLLEKQSKEEWFNVYIEYLKETPMISNGHKYVIYFDERSQIPYIAEEVSHKTFQYGLGELKTADLVLDGWASSRPMYRSAIIQGVQATPESLIAPHREIFSAAFNLEREFERLNKIKPDVFN